MCHGEENRLFVKSSRGVVLELDTSTTTFKKVRTINPGYSNYIGLCYVPDPHRLIVVGDENEVRAMSCVEKEVIWKTKLKPGCLLYALSHDVLFLSDRSNKLWCLDPGSGLQFQEILLRDYMHELEHMCLVNCCEYTKHFILQSEVNNFLKLFHNVLNTISCIEVNYLVF